MNSGKFDGIYKLFLDYKSEISKSIPDKLKCVKCKHVLINACQVPCGCRYCFDCLNEIMEKGVVHCPGNTDECKNEDLSNNNFDYRANKKIFQFIVKCPEESCLHECEIIKMEEHLRICGKLSKKCPFSDLGCDNRKMASEEVNEHCQSSNFNHCKILINMIDNIRNDIDSLKVNDGNNEIRIDKLEIELKVKSELNDSVNEEMKLIKLENENLKQYFDKRFEEISKDNKNENLQIIESINKEICEIKIERDKMKIEKGEIKQEYEKMKNLEKDLEKLISEMQNENQKRIELINAITIETNNKSEMMGTRINKLNKIVDKFEYATIEWTIDKLIERKNNNENIFSEYFTSIIKPYKLRLLFYADGWNTFRTNGCSIFFCIYSDANKFVSWPCKCDVTISIVHKTNSNLNKSITRYCEIPVPPDNSYSSTANLNPPIQFDYSYTELEKYEMILDNCLNVECFVNFK